MGKPGPNTDRSCSGALSRHIVHRVAMHVPDHGGVHFDAVVPKMAKQNFAFPASTRTMFLNWKVKPLEVHHERQRHKSSTLLCTHAKRVGKKHCQFMPAFCTQCNAAAVTAGRCKSCTKTYAKDGKACGHLCRQ
jgi:hypothetical protein